MNRKFASIVILLLLLSAFAIFVSGCMNIQEVCNYDSVCDEGETDNCIDCVDVLGRGVDIVVKTDDVNQPVGGP